MCVAIPAKIVEINDIHATVDIMGIKKHINIQLITQVKLGDYVLVHAGFAIEKIQEREFDFINNTLKTILPKVGEDTE